MNERILLIDDDTNFLDSCRRQLQKQYSLETAAAPEAGLELLHGNAYAVIVSDMQMPGMNGVEFLRRARKISPGSVRLMLTGNADQHTATSAINEAHVYRFLNKPCPPQEMAQAISDALTHYRVATAERELIEQTVLGSVKMLTDILAMVSPTAFGRASQVSRVVKSLCEELGLDSPWEMEMAAMLSQLGCVAIPEAVLERAYRGQLLNDHETEMLARQTRTTTELISNIPRLEPVARLIQQLGHDLSKAPRDASDHGNPGAELPVAVLRIAFDFVDAESRTSTATEAYSEIRKSAQRYDLSTMAALKKVLPGCDPSSAKELTLAQLECGQILAADVLSTTGRMLVGKGQEVNFSLMQRLNNFAHTQTIDEPLYVVKSVCTGAPT